MSDRLLAVCPGCGEQLRIPTEWADKAVKCKKCGGVVRAKPAAIPNAAPAQPAPWPAVPESYFPPAAVVVPQPVVVPVAYAHPANAFGSFDQPTARKKRGYKKSNGGLAYAVVGVGLLLLAGGAVAAFIFKDQLSAMFQPKSTSTDPGPFESKPIAKSNTAPARRMLAIGITKYLYCNPLIGGKNPKGTSEFGEAIRSLAFRWEVPEGKENNQLFVLTDAEGKLPPGAAVRPMLKPIVAETLAKFFATSRPQDRLVAYFGGHAVAKDGKAYLVPMEGELGDPATLLPLEDLWKMIAACPSQQKVLIFDVCRLSTDDNAIRPGSEPMSEELEKLLLAAPPGVQVVLACSANQNAAEYRGAPDEETPSGSAFLGALRTVVRKAKQKLAPTDPFPVEGWVEGVAKRLSSTLPKDHPATPKLAGEPGPTSAAPEEAVAVRFDFPPVPQGADAKDIDAAFAALDTPSLLGEATKDDSQSFLVFAAEAMAEFKPDPPIEDVAKNLDKHGSRAATLKALKSIRESWATVAEPGRESILKDGLGQAIDDNLKKAVEREQDPLAKLSLKLGNIVEDLTDDDIKAEAAKEPNKFWKAMYSFALAQAKLRFAFSEEVNFALGKVRVNEIEGAERGVRLVQVPRMKQKKVAPEAKQAQEILEELAASAKGTPWEVVAKQWRSISLGLEWRPREKNVDTSGADEKK